MYCNTCCSLSVSPFPSPSNLGFWQPYDGMLTCSGVKSVLVGSNFTIFKFFHDSRWTPLSHIGLSYFPLDRTTSGETWHIETSIVQWNNVYHLYVSWFEVHHVLSYKFRSKSKLPRSFLLPHQNSQDPFFLLIKTHKTIIFSKFFKLSSFLSVLYFYLQILHLSTLSSLHLSSNSSNLIFFSPSFQAHLSNPHLFSLFSFFFFFNSSIFQPFLLYFSRFHFLQIPYFLQILQLILSSLTLFFSNHPFFKSSFLKLSFKPFSYLFQILFQTIILKGSAIALNSNDFYNELKKLMPDSWISDFHDDEFLM